jgi:hypothetical protein
MARRQQRRPFRQPRERAPDRAREQAALEAGARRLLAGYDERSLQSLVNDLRLLRDEADRNAYEQPSPDALRSYRRVARELAEAETALTLLA